MMKMQDTQVPSCACLDCGKILDMAANFKGRKPKEGDISICINCGHIMAFDAQLMFRELNDGEILDIAGDKELIAVMKALAEANLYVKGKKND
jgi:hypothetical protein